MGFNGGLTPRRRAPEPSPDRGQAELIGLVIVMGMAVAGMTVILGYGTLALQDSQGYTQDERAEHVMTQFDSTASLVALGDADTHQLDGDFDGSGSSFYVDENAGWMNITIVNTTETEEDPETTEVMNVTMGAVVYENDDRTVAYQGGGVWKQSRDGTVMVSPPEFHLQTSAGEPTLTIPLVVVRGGSSLGSPVTISRNKEPETKFPVDGDSVLSNPFSGGYAEITIQSEYYEAWGAYLEDRADGEVTYDHDRKTVNASLASTVSRYRVESGAFIANGESGTLRFDAGDDDIGIDTYNSSSGPYSAADARPGEIRSEGPIELWHGKFTASTIVSGAGEVEVKHDGWTPGNLSYAGYIEDVHHDPPALDFHFRGWIRDDAEVSKATSVGTLTEDKADEFMAENDNTDTDTIVQDGKVWEFTEEEDDMTLESGDYFVNQSSIKFTTGNEKLTLDLAGGDINLVIDTKQWIIEDGVRLEIINPDGGTARVFLAGSNEPIIKVRSGGVVKVTGDKAPSFWIYGHRQVGTDLEVMNNGSFTGVFYAPGRDKDTSAIISDNSDLYGALVIQDLRLETNSTIHFDESLDGDDPDDGNTYTSDITFLHVTVNEVEVE